MEELRKMILQRGGEVRPVLRNKGMVKYIIAPMLTQMKFKQFQNYKVVKEGWITESCKEGKLLDWTRWKLTVQGGWEEEGRKGMEGFLKPTQASQASQVSPAVKTRQGDKRSDSQATTPVTSVAPQGPPGLTTTVNPPIVTKTEQASPQPPALPQLTARTSISAPSPQIHKPAMITPHRSTPAVPPRPHEAAPSLSKSPDPPAMGPVISPEKDKTTPKTQRPEGAFDFYSTKESNDDAARLLKNQEWRLKNTAERGNEGGFIDGYYQNSR
jgi:DNA repair protein REV1